ncbi:S-ribosylhomocysteine lyase [Breznakia sp. PF5-3]|uniref:S-ribosylhomocysteine lyase n=1 Tax=unclassified Breznakia TaxID=2623764 RepID=UPI002405B533|nr:MULTISPECIES: S-ribosylhomocysteine lyase [unclassified Breznakia]MDF9824217.1 S-ribosylhomocysteine lyase [Breznakia sp. PM6-1]MDF9835015.1 S-ribosylhomocysteine lyase [Breznakia sp. PF5-3]MDF9837260.1 S-ribosylhomocysteine lyase [Breznakia sp. PFB2-8]MDF9859250.1 S-ribosylhomocysteine lyase [Breznakia sp. PH5-24]
MDKIASFTVDHLRLKKGLYVSRKDYLASDTLTTFDIRMCEPNKEPVLNTAELHAIEHLGATFLRNHKEYNEKTVYFGPMGCRTGFYVIFKGDLKAEDIVDVMKEMFAFIKDYEGEIPGADPKSCGNYLDLNLPMAKYVANKFYTETLLNLHEENLRYPEE